MWDDCIDSAPNQAAYMLWACLCRGAGAYGDVKYASCGLWSTRDGQPIDYQDLPFPKEQVGAVANINPDYAGSCGRCYEVRSGKTLQLYFCLSSMHVQHMVCTARRI